MEEENRTPLGEDQEQDTQSLPDGGERKTLPPKLIRRSRKGWAAPLGLFVILLAVFGFVSLIVGGVNLYYQATDDSDEREALSKLVNPIVMLDVANFSDPGKLSPSLVLQTTIWSYMQTADPSKLNTDPEGRLLLPSADLDVACTALYGGAAVVVRESMAPDGSDITQVEEGTPIFEYLPEYDSFAVPIMGEYGEYAAKVENIDKNGSEARITVGYYPLNGEWYDAYTETKTTDVAEKYRIFILKKSGSTGKYYVCSQQNADLDVAF